MQKSRLNDRHFTRDYNRKNRDRAGGYCCTLIRMDGWKEYPGPVKRKFCKRQEAKAERRFNKLLIAEELLMIWEQITEEQIEYVDLYHFDDYLEEDMYDIFFYHYEDKEEEEYDDYNWEKYY